MPSIGRVIAGASFGTLLVEYDIYLYGSLAVFFGGLFFSSGNETAQLLASFLTFGAGFGVRPLGARGLGATIMLVLAVYIRLRMSESPVFAKLKREGKTTKNALEESFANPNNLKFVVIALFGATAGQGVVWYTGQFYAFTFRQATLKLDGKAAYILMSFALFVSTPMFAVMGHLSDRVGRKRILLVGCALGAIL